MVASVIDHLVYGVASLEAGIDALERSFGVRAAGGGQHLGRGTHNALLALGGGSYLEIIAPDPAQKEAPRPLPFGLNALERARLTGWAIRTADLDALVRQARAAGYDPGRIESMERRRPDGITLHWRLTASAPAGSSFVLPFAIDWGTSPHPSASAPQGVSLVGFQIVHPDPPTIESALAALHVDVRIVHGREPALVAQLDTPRGRRELR